MTTRMLMFLTITAVLAFSAGTPAWAATAAAQEKQAAKKAEAKVVDPVCRMTVDPKTSEKAVYQGKTYYFCSRAEKESFEKSPEKYVRPEKGKK